MDGEELRKQIGQAAMGAMDSADDELAEANVDFFHATQRYARTLIEKGFEPLNVVGASANMAAGAAFLEARDD